VGENDSVGGGTEGGPARRPTRDTRDTSHYTPEDSESVSTEYHINSAEEGQAYPEEVRLIPVGVRLGVRELAGVLPPRIGVLRAATQYGGCSAGGWPMC